MKGMKAVGKCSDCIVGIMYEPFSDYQELTSQSELIKRAKSNEEANIRIEKNGWGFLHKKYYELKDYCDRRKSTDLTRFIFCPVCGKKIDWKAIKKKGGAE